MALERVFSKVFPILSLWELKTTETWPILHDLQNLCKGPLDIATYQIYKLLAS